MEIIERLLGHPGPVHVVTTFIVLMCLSASAFGQVSYFNVEAEDMTLYNYIINANSAASNDSLIKLSAAGVTGDATTMFSGPTGIYDMRVWYFDESDGACTFNVYVGGTKIDSWVANQNLGSADPVQATRTCRIISSVSITNGAEIKLEGVQTSQEWGRYDNTEIYTHGYQPPTVGITSPSNNSVFTEGSAIEIDANASATGTSVSKVEFFQGSTKLGEATASPYSYTWTNVPAGSYTITAKVTDGAGVTQTSAPVNVIVTNGQGGVVINFTTPASGATLQNIVAVSAKAYDTYVGTADGNGMYEVVFYLLQGTKVLLSHQELTATYDWNIDVAGLTTGDYTLEAIGIGNFNDTSTAQIPVHVIGDPRPAGKWVLTFSDEFNGPAGSSPDPTKWTLPSYQRRTNGSWASDNAFLDGNGDLAIRVVQLSPGSYSSADVSTQSSSSDGANVSGAKFSQTYGKFECRAKLPQKSGWWVAFWMMQGSQGSVGNGSVDGAEVDIMESFGWSNRVNHTVIWDGYTSGISQSSGSSDFQPDIHDGFHIYTLIWDPTMYYFYVDSMEVFRTAGGGSPCNQPGFLQFSGEISTDSWAVDPTWANSIDGSGYPDTFLVDWVHVYRDQSLGLDQSPASEPYRYSLDQNFPNPFNPSTSLHYQLKQGSYVTLKVYDALGREAVVLADGRETEGYHSATFDGSKLASGIYFARLFAMPSSPNEGSAKPFVRVIKMLLIK